MDYLFELQKLRKQPFGKDFEGNDCEHLVKVTTYFDQLDFHQLHQASLVGYGLELEYIILLHYFKEVTLFQVDGLSGFRFGPINFTKYDTTLEKELGLKHYTPVCKMLNEPEAIIYDCKSKGYYWIHFDDGIENLIYLGEKFGKIIEGLLVQKGKKYWLEETFRAWPR